MVFDLRISFVVALIAHLPGMNLTLITQSCLRLNFCVAESHMAVGTGFGQLFRGLGNLSMPSVEAKRSNFLLSGQVSGVAISSAMFQSILDSELRKRIHSPDADNVST